MSVKMIKALTYQGSPGGLWPIYINPLNVKSFCHSDERVWNRDRQEYEAVSVATKVFFVDYKSEHRDYTVVRGSPEQFAAAMKEALQNYSPDSFVDLTKVDIGEHKLCENFQ